MSLSAGKEFRKTERCPASETLLAFTQGALPPLESDEVEVHSADCEFCSMELEMYRRFGVGIEEIAAPRMPRPLFLLASKLLPKRTDRGDADACGPDGHIDLDQACGAF